MTRRKAAEDACSWCGIPINEHPLTDACAIEAEARADTGELARLREALEQIAALQPKGPFRHPTDELAEAQVIARAALVQHTEEKE